MTWLPYFTMFLLMLVGLMLIFIILLQRGRGGGLAGALGGMGGTSAFGTRAGDVFTKITIGLAIVWTILAAGNVYALRITGNRFKGGTAVVPTAPALESTAGSDVQLGDESKPEDGAATPKKSDAAGENSTTEAKPATPSEPATPAENNPPADPADKPATDNPATDKPATDKPATDKPDAEKPEAETFDAGKPDAAGS